MCMCISVLCPSFYESEYMMVLWDPIQTTPTSVVSTWSSLIGWPKCVPFFRLQFGNLRSDLQEAHLKLVPDAPWWTCWLFFVQKVLLSNWPENFYSWKPLFVSAEVFHIHLKNQQFWCLLPFLLSLLNTHTWTHPPTRFALWHLLRCGGWADFCLRSCVTKRCSQPNWNHCRDRGSL